MQNLNNEISNKKFFPIFGFFLSIACAIHCLALPFLLLLAPNLGIEFLENQYIENSILTIAAIISSYNILNGFKVHKSQGLLYFLLLTLLSLFMHYISSPSIEHLYGTTTSILLVFLLIWNYKLTHKHS